MSTKPTDIPVNLDGTWDDPTWGEQGGPFFVPPHEDAGLAPGDKLASNTWNYELQHLARWSRATRDRMVLSDRGLFGSFLLPGSATWTLTGGSLDAWLGATWVLVDADDNGGVVVQYNVPAGAPHTFDANATTEVYLKEDGTAVYRVVGVDPAPADAVLVWEVVTDGTEVTSATVKLPTIPVLKSVQVEDLAVSENVVVAGDVAIGGVCTMKDALAVSGAVTMESTLGVAGTLTVGGDTTISGNVTCEEFTATGEANFGGDVIVAGLIEVGGSASINSSLGVTSNATVGGTLGVTGAVTCNGDVTVAGTTTCNGEANLNGTTRVRAQLAILGADGGSLTSDPSATLQWNGTAEFLGRLSVPQTGTTMGDISRDGGGRLRYHDNVGNKFIHSSGTGYVRKAGQTESGTVTPGNPVTGLSQVAITPFAAGDVTVTVLGHFTWGSDASSVRILLRDHGTMTTINGGGTGTPEYPPVGALARSRSCGASVRYTLPSAAARVFSVTLTAAGADIDYQDLVLVVETCQS